MLGRDPTVLGIAGRRRPRFFVNVFHAVDEVAGDGIPLSLGIDAVNTGRIEPEHLRLYLRRERPVPELFHQQFRHL